MTQIILTQALYYLIVFIQKEPTFFILFNTPEYNTTPIYTIYLLFSQLVPHMTINLIETIKIKKFRHFPSKYIIGFMYLQLSQTQFKYFQF
jgi:hypothetical protein